LAQRNHSELSHMAGAVDDSDSTINIVVVIIIIIIIIIIDYADYVKKAMILLWQFRQMRRVQLSLLLDPEQEIDDFDAEEPPIGW